MCCCFVAQEVLRIHFVMPTSNAITVETETLCSSTASCSLDDGAPYFLVYPPCRNRYGVTLRSTRFVTLNTGADDHRHVLPSNDKTYIFLTSSPDLVLQASILVVGSRGSLLFEEIRYVKRIPSFRRRLQTTYSGEHEALCFRAIPACP